MYPDQRVGIFIDVQNIYHSAKNLYQARVNFDHLVKTLTKDRFLIRTIAYVVKSEGIVPQEHPGGEESFWAGRAVPRRSGRLARPCRP